jgi:hypothetical protein
MAVCPLCSERPARRYCPAKSEQICSVCCGTKREVEIYCPGDCTYLVASRGYENEKRIPDPEVAAKADRFNDEFVYNFSPVLDAISRQVVAERMQSQWLVDNDVIDVYNALVATMKTLSSGIHYESLPDGPVRQALFHRLKSLLDKAMEPQESADRRALKVSEAIDALEFLSFVAQVNSSVRPKGRRYLDWLDSMFIPMAGADEPSPSGGLILP